LILLCNTGKALKGKRSQVQLCTKFGIKFTKEGGMAYDGSRKYVRSGDMLVNMFLVSIIIAARTVVAMHAAERAGHSLTACICLPGLIVGKYVS